MDDPFAGWMDAPEGSRLEGAEVHVHGWRLDGTRRELARLVGTLTDDELGRMRSFHFAADAERFVWARGGLRKILGRYVGIAPEGVRFVYGTYGKPELASGQAGIHFNLSHTKSFAVAAFSMAGAVGIDVEERHPVSRNLGVEVFSHQENRTLEALANEEYTEAFFNGWTRKEAICKAEGLGFHLPVRAFSVSLLPGDASRIEETGGVLSRVWHLSDLPLSEEVAGCLATGESPCPLRRFYWRYDP